MSVIADSLLSEDAADSSVVDLNDDRFYERHPFRYGPVILLASLFVVGIALGIVGNYVSEVASWYVYTIAFVIISGSFYGVACYIAIKAIMRPCCQSAKNHELRQLVETMFVEHLFSSDVLDQFMRGSMVELGNQKEVIRSVKATMGTQAFAEIVDGAVDGFFRTAEGVAIEAGGVGRDDVRPFVLKAVDQLVTNNCAGFVRGIIGSNAITGERLAEATRLFLLEKCDGLRSDVIADSVAQIVGRTEHRAVYWGVLAGLLAPVIPRALAGLATLLEW